MLRARSRNIKIFIFLKPSKESLKQRYVTYIKRFRRYVFREKSHSGDNREAKLEKSVKTVSDVGGRRRRRDGTPCAAAAAASRRSTAEIAVESTFGLLRNSIETRQLAAAFEAVQEMRAESLGDFKN